MSAGTTPFTGPWKRIGSRAIADANGDVVCEVFSGPCGVEEADKREALIAAAPALLTACQAQHEAIDRLLRRLTVLRGIGEGLRAEGYIRSANQCRDADGALGDAVTEAASAGDLRAAIALVESSAQEVQS